MDDDTYLDIFSDENNIDTENERENGLQSDRSGVRRKRKNHASHATHANHAANFDQPPLGGSQRALVDSATRTLRSFKSHPKNTPSQTRGIKAEKLASYRVRSETARYFQGNINYLRFFEAEQERFANFTSEFGSTGLVGSFVAADGTSRLRQRDATRQGGCYWSAEEKDRFFELLARYSIARVDEIHRYLPSKSTLEILAYYELLKSETNKYKQSRKQALRLVSYDEIPASAEMSREFVEMESSQASLLVSVTNIRDSDLNFRFKKKYPLLNQNSNLINFDTMLDLTEQVYKKNNVLDKLAGAKRMIPRPLALDEEAKYVIRCLVHNLTYELLLNVVEKKLLSAPSEDVLRNKPVVVRHRDVLDAAVGLATRRPVRLKSYWAGIAARLRLLLLDDSEELSAEDAAEFAARGERIERHATRLRPDASARVLDRWRSHTINVQDFRKFIDLCGGDGDSNSASSDDGASSDDDAMNELLDGSLPYVAAVLRATPADELEKPGRRLSIADLLKKENGDSSESVTDSSIEGDTDVYLARNQELAEKLLLLETSLLERRDHEEAVKNEHFVLTMLSSKPEEIETNDETLVKFYICHKYYPEMVGYKRRQHERVGKRAKVAVEGGWFDENDPFSVLRLEGVTEDMLLMHSYGFAAY